MDIELKSGEVATTASEAEVAEGSFAHQLEDHTLPARQVLREQRDNAANGLPSYVFIP
jgi:hypothetical protein